MSTPGNTCVRIYAMMGSAIAICVSRRLFFVFSERPVPPIPVVSYGLCSGTQHSSVSVERYRRQTFTMSSRIFGLPALSASLMSTAREVREVKGM